MHFQVASIAGGSVFLVLSLFLPLPLSICLPAYAHVQRVAEKKTEKF